LLKNFKGPLNNSGILIFKCPASYVSSKPYLL
jgi:hypothetical protein